INAISRKSGDFQKKMGRSLCPSSAVSPKKQLGCREPFPALNLSCGHPQSRVHPMGTFWQTRIDCQKSVARREFHHNMPLFALVCTSTPGCGTALNNSFGEIYHQ